MSTLGRQGSFLTKPPEADYDLCLTENRSTLPLQFQFGFVAFTVSDYVDLVWSVGVQRGAKLRAMPFHDHL